MQLAEEFDRLRPLAHVEPELLLELGQLDLGGALEWPGTRVVLGLALTALLVALVLRLLWAGAAAGIVAVGLLLLLRLPGRVMGGLVLLVRLVRWPDRAGRGSGRAFRLLRCPGFLPIFCMFFWSKIGRFFEQLFRQKLNKFQSKLSAIVL